jgi:hypothetical protein
MKFHPDIIDMVIESPDKEKTLIKDENDRKTERMIEN